MKYAIVIPDGCADEPQDSLGGRTPLQAARTPHLAPAAPSGALRRSRNMPRPLTPARHDPDPRTQPPHDVPDRPGSAHLPQGPGSNLLHGLMERSKAVLAEHPVNQARRAAGKKAATQVWLWGQGKAPSLRPFRDVY